MPYPPVRAIDALQIEHEGMPAILLRDPQGITPEPLVVPLPMFMVMTMLDGRRETAEIQEELTRLTGGMIVTGEQIGQVVAELDRHFLLYNERAAARLAELELEFEAMPTRPAFHAGEGYPDQPEECREYFASLFAGFRGEGNGAAPRGLIVPHIDFRVGGRLIARTLARLDGHAAGMLCVILGVAHQPSRNLFTLTGKSFETPLGLARTDARAAARLRELFGAERLGGEYAHRSEHSVEFQAVGLRYLFGEAAAAAPADAPAAGDFTILPILCGSMQQALTAEGPPRQTQPELDEFIQALRTAIAEHEGPVCVLASVDLSHVGRKFGDERGVDELRMASIRAADEKMLERAAALDAEGFFDHFRADANARNVDAVTAVYVLLHLMQQGRSEPIDYQQWLERETDSMVSYAGLAIY